jgi:RNA polymerase sigma-70 factor (ECF subfamily)
MIEQTSEEAAFRDLFNATYPKLVAYARRRSFDTSNADDVVSEVYATAWRRRDSLDAAEPPLPWLYGIASNVLRNQWRSESRRLQLVERLEAQPAATPTNAPGESDDLHSDLHEEIRSALKRLSFDDQEVLRLATWEGLPQAEIGQVLGCSTNAVGIRLHRARQRLETELNVQRRTSGRRGGANDD